MTIWKESQSSGVVGCREISISLGLLIASFKSSISLLCTWFLRELFYNLLLWVSFSQFLLIVLWIFCFVYFEAILSDVHMFMIFTCSWQIFFFYLFMRILCTSKPSSLSSLFCLTCASFLWEHASSIFFLFFYFHLVYVNIYIFNSFISHTMNYTYVNCMIW